MTVLAIGSLAYDNVKSPYGEVKDAIGGSATYASLAASIFAPVRVVGIVGDDFTEHLKLLSARSICTKGVEVIKDAKTFRWDGYYEGDMSQAVTVNTCLNVFEFFKPQLSDEYSGSDYVLLGNIQPDLQLHVLSQLKNPKLIATDTMNLWINTCPDRVKEVFKRTDIVLINDAEAKLLCETQNLVKAAEDILSLGAKWVIIKKGEHGCVLFGKDTYFSCPAYPLSDVVDPTGAGDSFAGGLVGYLASVGKINNDTIKQGIIIGTTIASFNIQKFSIDNLTSLEKKDVFQRMDKLIIG